MERFRIQWRNSTRKDLRSLPRQEVPRIIAAASQLAEEPFPNGSQKLSASERTYRIRVGDYRIVYEVLTIRRSSRFNGSDTERMSIGGDLMSAYQAPSVSALIRSNSAQGA
jgi:mRNA interferase RelE/StbE